MVSSNCFCRFIHITLVRFGRIYAHFLTGAEIAAIRGAFASDDSTPVHVGSAKPNVGHLESASGVAGLVKAILMLENGAIPPSINLVELKESIRGSDISVSSCIRHPR